MFASWSSTDTLPSRSGPWTELLIDGGADDGAAGAGGAAGTGVATDGLGCAVGVSGRLPSAAVVDALAVVDCALTSSAPLPLRDEGGLLDA